MEKNNKEIKLGDVYVFQLATGAVVTGVLIGTSENLIGDKVQRYYRLALNESKYINFVENEIVNIHTVEIPEDKSGYFKDFESKHGVKCFDGDDNLLPASVIMGNSLIGENVWDKLTETERIEFVEQIDLEPENVVELINVYADERKKCGELRSKRIQLLSKHLKLINNREKIKSMFPELRSVYDTLYRELGIEELLQEI